MSRRRSWGARPPRPVFVLLVSALVLGCSSGAEPSGPTVTIGEQVVAVEIVRSRSEQSLGLGDRDSLEWGRGMMFLYDEPGFFTFWMKRMRFDIDIVWIRGLRIVGISAMVPYPREDPNRPATVRAPELVDMVLEVPAGYAVASGWRKGDPIELSWIP